MSTQAKIIAGVALLVVGFGLTTDKIQKAGYVDLVGWCIAALCAGILVAGAIGSKKASE